MHEFRKIVIKSSSNRWSSYKKIEIRFLILRNDSERAHLDKFVARCGYNFVTCLHFASHVDRFSI